MKKKKISNKTAKAIMFYSWLGVTFLLVIPNLLFSESISVIALIISIADITSPFWFLEGGNPLDPTNFTNK